ncbi:MAG: recombinase family protein, partial [Leucobacter sp.]
LGNSAYDPTDPMGKMMFNMLATFAEFEADLIRMRTREGMAVAKAKGRLRGKKPKLSPTQEKHLVALWQSGEHTSAELASEFGVARSTVYRAVERAGVSTRTKEGASA